MKKLVSISKVVDPPKKPDAEIDKIHGNHIYIEGNNGGDFIAITDLGDGRIILESGSSCVCTIDAIVPVEFITAILSEAIIKYDGNINAVIDSFGWSQDFKNELKSKIKADYIIEIKDSRRKKKKTQLQEEGNSYESISANN